MMPNVRRTQPAAKDSNSQLTSDSRNELVYQFHSNSIHVEIINENPWFLAKDICDALGIQNSKMALKSLEDDEKLGYIVYTSGQGRSMNFVDESGLYSLVFQSRKKEAQKFRKWVTRVVLPEIRRTGGFFGTLSGLPIYEHEGMEMYRYAEVLTALEYKKSGSSYKLQERYPKDFAVMDGAVLVSKVYATVMACRRRASFILKGIKARQLELPFSNSQNIGDHATS